MGKEDEEIERLRRLRDKQVAGRDARSRADRKRAQTLQSRKKKISFSEEFNNLPAKYTWPLVGAPVGFLMGIFIGWLAQVTFSINAIEITALLVAFIGAFVAFMLGRIRDSGHEDWK